MNTLLFEIEEIFPFFDKSAIYFDIETTGLSPQNSQIYIIGFMYYKENKIYLHQIFCENLSDEKEAVISFFSYLENFNKIISFNGDAFDIKYISHLCEKYNIYNKFNDLDSVDIYKLIKPYKIFLNVDNLKQKTLEKYIGYDRVDIFSGGELIGLYKEFLYIKDENEKKKYKAVLLRHNYDDMLGMAHISYFIHLSEIFKHIEINHLDIHDMEYIKSQDILNALRIKFKINNSSHYLCKEIYYDNNIIIKIYTDINNDTILEITYPVIKDELKYYLKDYKNYFYIPSEDIIIHKDLAQFVDKENKKKATKETAFLKHNTDFILLPKSYKKFFSECKLFSYNLKDKNEYIDVKDFLKEITENNANLNLIDIHKYQ